MGLPWEVSYFITNSGAVGVARNAGDGSWLPKCAVADVDGEVDLRGGGGFSPR